MKSGVHSQEIQDQIDKLFSTILLEQQKFDCIKPADEDKKSELNDYLDQYAALRGRPLFFKYGSTGRGHGPFTELKDGSVKYDLINGIGFNILGHSHPIFIKSCLESATVDSMMVGNLQSYEEPFRFSEIILDRVKDSSLKHFWFAGSGSFANDIALKILWQKSSPKYEVIAFKKAFAGRSVATQEITANEAYRDGMPVNLNVHHVPHWDQRDPENSAQKTIDALNKLWDERGDVFSCITLEIIQGEGGFVYGPKDYYVEICEWARSKNIPIWFDEVQTFGRTRELFAFQMFGLQKYADIVTVAKAMQGAGVLYTEELNPKPGLIAGTFNGALPAIRSGYKIIKFLTEGPFYGENGRIHEIEKRFIEGLTTLANNSCQGKIGYAGGAGTMIAFEVGDTSKEVTLNFVKKLFEDGVIAFIAGKDPTRVRFLLPVSITNEQIDDVLSIVEKTALEFFK